METNIGLCVKYSLLSNFNKKCNVLWSCWWRILTFEVGPASWFGNGERHFKGRLHRAPPLVRSWGRCEQLIYMTRERKRMLWVVIRTWNGLLTVTWYLKSMIIKNWWSDTTGWRWLVPIVTVSHSRLPDGKPDIRPQGQREWICN